MDFYQETKGVAVLNSGIYPVNTMLANKANGPYSRDRRNLGYAENEGLFICISLFRAVGRWPLNRFLFSSICSAIEEGFVRNMYLLLSA